MRFSLWALTALILGALATHFLLQDRGYVLIEFRGYLLQMSVPGTHRTAAVAVRRRTRAAGRMASTARAG
jgi:uncharacterized protein HemY